MVALLGFAAIAIDAGDLFAEQRDLQTAADSGALAGALALAHGEDWSTAATGFVGLNRTANPNLASLSTTGVTLTEQIEGPPELDRAVRVTLQEDGVPLFFAPFLDPIWSSGGSVTATATAAIKPLAAVGDLFPVLGEYYIHRLRIKMVPTSGPPLSFELDEGAPSGGYSTWSVGFPANMSPGYWDLTLESIDDNTPPNVYASWDNIGRLHVIADPLTPYIATMQRTGDVVTVVAASAEKPTLELDKGPPKTAPDPLETGAVTPENLRLWRWDIEDKNVAFCAGGDDYEVQRLFLNGLEVARFPDFHQYDGAIDVPIVSFSMPPSVRPGDWVEIQAKVHAFTFGQFFPLKIDSNINLFGGGSRRVANVYDAVGLDEEVTGSFASGSEGWTPMFPPLAVDNKLTTKGGSAPGGSGGVIKNGWAAREENARAAGWDEVYLSAEEVTGSAVPEIRPFDPGYIIVPIVYFRNNDGWEDITYHNSILKHSVSLDIDQFRIAMFAGYYVTDPPLDPSDSSIDGYFIRSVGSRQWDPDYDPDPDDVYVETVVLTE